MLSNLQRHSGTAVVPTASQVVHRLVASKEFALTLVPESDNPPHMAKFGHDQYFKRSGDSFYRMEHFDLEDMFGRRQRSRLVLRLRSQGNAIVLSLYNDGRRTAKAPYLALRIRSPFENSEYGVDGNGTFGLHILNRNRHQPSFGGNTTIVIHPGQTVDITRIKVGDLFDPKAEAPVGGHTFEYDIASEDEPLRTGVERLPW
jgi:hypothetical protein